MNANVEKLNDAPILDQMDGQYMKYMMFIIWKIAKDCKVTITLADIQQFAAEWGENAVLFTHGHSESIDFSVVTRARAEEIAAHQASITSQTVQ